MTTPEALKALYEALDGDPAVVAGLSKNVELLNALALKYEGEGGAVTIPEAVENITAVAGNIGSKEGAKYGTVKVQNNASITVTVRSFSNDTIAGYYYPLGYKDVSIAAGASADIGVLLDYEIVEDKYRIRSTNTVTGRNGVKLAATAGTGLASADIAEVKTNVFGLHTISNLGTLASMASGHNVTIFEALS